MRRVSGSKRTDRVQAAHAAMSSWHVSRGTGMQPCMRHKFQHQEIKRPGRELKPEGSYQRAPSKEYSGKELTREGRIRQREGHRRVTHEGSELVRISEGLARDDIKDNRNTS
jgi:hypothetical protein